MDLGNCLPLVPEPFLPTKSISFIYISLNRSPRGLAQVVMGVCYVRGLNFKSLVFLTALTNTKIFSLNGIFKSSGDFLLFVSPFSLLIQNYLIKLQNVSSVYLFHSVNFSPAFDPYGSSTLFFLFHLPSVSVLCLNFQIGFFSGRKRESIFKSPDDPNGKVGVTGSGKGLTEFQKREKHLHLKGGNAETDD